MLPNKESPGVQQIKSSFGPLVDLNPCIYRERFSEPASSYIIKSFSTDSRTIVNYNELPEMTVDEFANVADSLGHDLKWCHFEVSHLIVFGSGRILTSIRVEYQMLHYSVRSIFANDVLAQSSV